VVPSGSKSDVGAIAEQMFCRRVCDDHFAVLIGDQHRIGHAGDGRRQDFRIVALGVLRPPALGDVVDDAEDELQRASLVENRHPRRGDDTSANSGNFDRRFVEELLGVGLEKLPLSLFDEIGEASGKQLTRRFSNHPVARNAVIFFTRLVDQDELAVTCVLDKDGRGHVVDDCVQESLIAIALCPPMIGNVVEGRHPPPTRHGLIDDAHGAAVAGLHEMKDGFPLGDGRQNLRGQALRIAGDGACLPAVGNHFLQRASGRCKLRRQVHDLEVASIAEHNPRVRIVHAETLRHVVEGRIQLEHLLAQRFRGLLDGHVRLPWRKGLMCLSERLGPNGRSPTALFRSV
jgi:hypothetical protein